MQCQVCHSQTYTNCYSCHTGTDENGLAYFTTELDFEDMKIGFNPDRLPGNNYKWALLRHVPVDPEVFAHYVEDGFPRFDVEPTWKRTSPHNIQRRTWQNASCNNCHGQRDLFLSETDLLDYEKKANFGLTVGDDQIPKPRSRTKPLNNRCEQSARRHGGRRAVGCKNNSPTRPLSFLMSAAKKAMTMDTFPEPSISIRTWPKD